MIAGMITGIAVMIVVWWTAAAAWTWYAFIGASVTSITALVVSPMLDRPQDSRLKTED
jgi:hypothetical protein